MQVSALGAAGYCTVISWGGSPNVLVRINCHLNDGTLADSAFSAMFLTHGNTSGSIAYVWANQPTTMGGYTPSSLYQWPGNIAIYRHSAGEYVVHLPGVGAPLEHHLQVTGYGDAFCKVKVLGQLSGSLTVRILCPAGDTRFNLLYLRDVGPTGVVRPKAAYVLATADEHVYDLYSSEGTTPTHTRLAAGEYIVTLPGMPKGGMALVTQYYAPNDARCYLRQIRRNAAPQKVRVNCTLPDGSPVDANFYLAYTK